MPLCPLAGEDRGYAERALLIYDGIHYDPLVMEGLGGTFTQKIFPITDDSVLVMASHLAREAQQVHVHVDATTCILWMACKLHVCTCTCTCILYIIVLIGMHELHWRMLGNQSFKGPYLKAEVVEDVTGWLG